MISVEEVPARKDKVHGNLLLNKNVIHDKEFKKKLFGGYDSDEVNRFLDLIIKDYKFIEDVVLKENKILKEDIDKFRGK